MSGADEENYLDRLLNSIEQQEEQKNSGNIQDNYAEDATNSELTNGTSQDDMLSAFADAGMLLSPMDIPEIEAEVFADDYENDVVMDVLYDANEKSEPVESEELSAAELLSLMGEQIADDTPDTDSIVVQDADNIVVPEMLSPDYSEPELSDAEMERLSSMELDNIIDGINAQDITVEELFNDNNADSGTKGDTVNDSIDAVVNETVDSAVDATDVVASVAVENVKTAVETAMDQQAGLAEDETAASNTSKEKKQKQKKEKPKKDKSKKGGIGAVLKNIFFVSEESTDESENAKKQGKAAAKEAKINDVKDSQAALKETILNEDGEKELDENQKLIKEMYGKEKQDEVAPKQGFFDKLRFRLAQFMKKSAEEDALEDAAEAEEYERKKQAKVEKQEADKIKKEEAKVEKEKKAEEAKAKKAAKQREKKPKVKKEPKPGDILKIKPQAMLLFILFVVGAIMLILMLNNTISYNRAISTAKASMENGDYARAYKALSGLELTGNDVVMYEQASVIMFVERHYESYENYTLMGRPVEALDALITGLVRYEKYYMRACDLGVDKQLIASREKILSKITEKYGISTTEATELAKLATTNYTQYYIKVEAYGKAKQ